MKPEIFHYDRLIKSEDLNHHGTLFAGRCAEWFVEAGFIAVASVLPAANIVCLKVHGMTFSRPMRPGEIARFSSRVVLVGRTSLTVYVSLATRATTLPAVSGFITFVHVDKQGQSKPHGLSLDLETDEEIALHQQALGLN
ncbi:MAG: hotdog domain-containing protein [Chloroflexota bacterium]|nr:hotdog domain-containing protein [Chloroflexota bacterium]